MQASSGGANPLWSYDPIMNELVWKLHTLAIEMDQVEEAVALSGDYSPPPAWDVPTILQCMQYPQLRDRYIQLQRLSRDRIEAALHQAKSARQFSGFLQTGMQSIPTTAPVGFTGIGRPAPVATHAPGLVAKAAIPAQTQVPSTYGTPYQGTPMAPVTDQPSSATRPAAGNLPGAQSSHKTSTSQTPLQDHNAALKTKDTPGKGKNAWLESREKAGLSVKFRAPSKGGKPDRRLITISWTRFKSYTGLPRIIPIIQDGKPVKDRDGNDRVAKIMDPADYGGNSYYDLGLCEAWFLHGDCVDWGLCPCRHWFFDAIERRWVLDSFLTQMSVTFEGPWLPPDDNASGYVGIPRAYISGRIFEPE